MIQQLKEHPLTRLPLQALRRLTGHNGNGAAPAGEREADMHLGEPGFLRQLVRRKKLESVFLFVTGKCNSTCRTCFYASEMDKGPDLSLAEIERLSDTAPRFDKLWLSGGEPVLRDGLAGILERFHRQNGVKTVNFPTNGIATDRLERVLDTVLTRCPELTIHLNFSLDGFGATHDGIRGVAGNFAKTLHTMERVQDRFGDHPKLLCNAATVVTPQGAAELLDLGAYLFGRFRLATQFFEAMRGTPRDPSMPRMTRPELEELHEALMPLYAAMGDRLFGTLPPGPRHLAAVYFLGTLRLLYRIQEENLDGPHPWGMRCTAGETTLVIDHEGSFRSCEMRPPVGNLRDHGFDLAAAFRSAEMRREVATIGGGEGARCWCTHTCWMLSSIKFSPRTILWEIPRAWWAGQQRHGATAFDPTTLDLSAIAQRYGLPA